MADQMTRFHQEMADRATVVRKGKSKGPLGAEVANAHKVAKAMLAEGDNLLNRDVLLKYMRAFGLVNNGWPGFNHLQSWCNSSKVGLLQIPTEFADFLIYCSKYRPNTMLEIGGFTGGTSFISAAFFKALNPAFKLTVVDLGDYVLLEQQTLDLLDIIIKAPMTSRDLYGQEFDIVFIDGDHSYGWSKLDYVNVGRYARKVCGMHDITAREYFKEQGGVFRFWRQLRHSLAHELPILQIGHAAPNSGDNKDGDWMGIGILDFGSLTDEGRKKLSNAI